MALIHVAYLTIVTNNTFYLFRTLEKASVNPNELAAVEKTNAPIEMKEEEKTVEEEEDE